MLLEQFAEPLRLGTVRGNPSNTNPCEQSGRSMRSATMRSTIESGTNSPRPIMGCARCPSEVPCATCSRSMSPVERCGAENLRASSFACVPFPAPEGREKLLHGPAFRAEARPESLGRLLYRRPRNRPFRAILVIAHDQLRFKLLNGVHRDTDNDEQRCAAKIKINAKPVQDELRKVAVKPVAASQVGRWFR